MHLQKTLIVLVASFTFSLTAFAEGDHFIFSQTQKQTKPAASKPKTLLELFFPKFAKKQQQRQVKRQKQQRSQSTTSNDAELDGITEMALAASRLDVKIHVHNICMPKQCFRLDVYLNNEHVVRWMTSPGQKYGHTDFPGSYTPEFVEARLISANGRDYVSHRGDPMPYAMHIDGSSKGVSNGFAIHGSSLAVNGEQASHGCMRLKTHHAKHLNLWVKKARDTRGLRVVTVEHTMFDYSKIKSVSPQAEQAIQQGVGGLF